MRFEEYAKVELPRLLGLARTFCQNQAEAEDLVQDVLIKVYVRWDSIAGLEARDAYVRRMLVNQFLSWRRRWGRRPAHARFCDSDEEWASSLGEDHFAMLVERESLLGEVRRLPARQRAVIGLRYFLDLSDGQIAETLGCSPTTVRVHASRALKSLRIAHTAPVAQAKEG